VAPRPMGVPAHEAATDPMFVLVRPPHHDAQERIVEAFNGPFLSGIHWKYATQGGPKGGLARTSYLTPLGHAPSTTCPGLSARASPVTRAHPTAAVLSPEGTTTTVLAVFTPREAPVGFPPAIPEPPATRCFC